MLYDGMEVYRKNLIVFSTVLEIISLSSTLEKIFLILGHRKINDFQHQIKHWFNSITLFQNAYEYYTFETNGWKHIWSYPICTNLDLIQIWNDWNILLTIDTMLWGLSKYWRSVQELCHILSSSCSHEASRLPSPWFSAVVTPIFKGDRNDAANYRPDRI